MKVKIVSKFPLFDVFKTSKSEQQKLPNEIKILEHGQDLYLSQLKFAASKQQSQILSTTPHSNNEVDDVDNNENMDYRFEQARLDSYQGWPVSYVSPADLAAAGFYYTKLSDRVKCFECNTEICKWEEGDIPMIEHQRWGGRCRFLRKIPCGNVPIGIDPDTIPLPRPRSKDVCGPYSCRLTMDRPSSATSSSRNESTEGKILTAGSFNLGIPKRPAFPEYATYKDRLQSFEQWPTALAQTKEQLSEAGFFYTKTGDQTTCYHCGGGLKNWEPQDDPWVQHAKWFSKCFHVLMVKGQDFVNEVTREVIENQTASSLDNDTENVNLSNYIKKVKNLNLEKKAEVQADETNTVTAAEPGPSFEDEAKNRRRSVSRIGSTSSNEGSLSSNNSSEEKKSVDDARACKICYSEEVGIVFLPCGHMVACVKCAPGMTDCALCREPVKMTVRVFFS